ncbi:S8 family serine peptidase [Amycolatopsis rubida]|uniref:S8 family serine peptidase n=1 Tax=Amycolatopsis rubida TaxID=112413 RepID=A0ABX0CBP5_9PSEU|nr:MULTISPECIES: S8 family serine peptidase [Amycolatopsis]MYW97456.1 S8 family serine peptidase [Amycolatopsis rubida]NEC62441.1 S8 family serine peptidase [Amycolatopsis rubida]OAP24334.1 Thermophilic serine proteinase precursor [Amycolatopsis sp. M39]
MSRALQLTFDGGRSHGHLKLARASDPLPRRKPSGGGGRGPTYPDPRTHARDLDRQVSSIRERHKARQPVLGIDPDLVVVIECNDALANLSEALERAGLQVLAARGTSALAAFSGDPEMTSFLDQRAAYESETTPSGHPRFQQLFDAIDVIRALEPSDVIDEDLAQRIASAESSDALIVDFTCWCTENTPDNERRHEETKRALARAGAAVLDSTRRFAVGLSVIRAEIPSPFVVDVVQTERIARASLLPRPLLSHPEVARRTINQLPTVQPPRSDAPMVAIIDSGIRASHPLLAPAVYETFSVASQLPDGGDESGHGTFVAGLALYGPLEKLLDAGGTLRPAGRVLGLRVLDHENAFPDAKLWQSLVETALSTAAERGAKVINLSIGDDRHPYHPPAPVNIAGVLDNLVQKHDLVLVVSAGNTAPGEHPSSEYARHLVAADQTGLLPPAMSALALTVGALVPDEHQGARPARESVSTTPIGKPGHPSPVTRTGPGIEQATKPELVAPGGTYVYDSDRKAVDQLGSDKAPVRLGGLYALERLAQDNPDPTLRQTIVNVLCAYLRMPHELPGDAPDANANAATHITHRELQQEHQVRLTAQRILTAHLNPGDTEEQPLATFWPDVDLDLTGAVLTAFNLAGCHLRAAKFDEAWFEGITHFSRALFQHSASFGEAVFTGFAFFTETKFTKASFTKSQFADAAWFGKATFTGNAWFTDTRFLNAAGFTDARFRGLAWFSRARFEGDAGFSGSSFTHTPDFDDALFNRHAEFIGTQFPREPKAEVRTSRSQTSSQRSCWARLDVSPAVAQKRAWPASWRIRDSTGGYPDGWHDGQWAQITTALISYEKDDSSRRTDPPTRSI